MQKRKKSIILIIIIINNNKRKKERKLIIIFVSWANEWECMQCVCMFTKNTLIQIQISFLLCVHFSSLFSSLPTTTKMKWKKNYISRKVHLFIDLFESQNEPTTTTKITKQNSFSFSLFRRYSFLSFSFLWFCSFAFCILEYLLI